MQRQEPWLGVVEGLLVVEVNEVLATVVGTHGEALLREGSSLLDAPDFQDPVGIEGVDAAACLVADHVDDVVVLERWSSAQVHCLQALHCGNVELVELVLGVQHHDLREPVQGL